MTVDLNQLPFLGKAEIVERVAWRHHLYINNPEELDLKPELRGQLSWWELLRAAEKAMQSAGVEIATARTEAEVAGAALRRDYFAGYDRTVTTILRMAVGELRIGPRWHLTCSVGLLGCGRRAVEGKLEMIPPTHWESGDMDWDRRRLTLAGDTVWTGVRIVELADLPPEVTWSLGEMLDELASPSPPRAEPAKTGAPGRPSSMHLVLAEHERRRSSGLTEDSRRKEAEALAAWFRGAHPTAPPMTGKTIRNKLPTDFQPTSCPK